MREGPRAGWRDAGEDHGHYVLARVTGLQAVATGRRRNFVLMSMVIGLLVRMGRWTVVVFGWSSPSYAWTCSIDTGPDQQCRQCEEHRDDADH